MWATLKVYASGGENGCTRIQRGPHFIVLQGSARYYDADGDHTDVGKHEGIMLPAGRITGSGHQQGAAGARADRLPGGAHDASGRLNIRGETMPGDRRRTNKCPWWSATAILRVA